MCRVCLVETGTSADLCVLHDGKRPSPRITYVWRPSNPGPALRLRGRWCVIEGTGDGRALVRFLVAGLRPPPRLTVALDDLEREAA